MPDALRWSLRQLKAHPRVGAVSILTLALGIGLTTAIVSVVKAVLLAPLPFRSPDALLRVYHVADGKRTVMSGPSFTDLRQRVAAVMDVAGVAGAAPTVSGVGEPVRVQAGLVTDSFFDVLGVRPLLGRTFRPGENAAGAHDVTVISFGFWQERFGEAADVIGRTIDIDGTPTEIVGVMPRGFSFPEGRALWLPIEYTPAFTSTLRGAWYLTVFARPRSGIDADQARSWIQVVGRQVAAEHPETQEGVDFDAQPLRESLVAHVRRPLMLLLAAVGLVLMIACVNVAHLQLARAAERRAEMALRQALGAGRLQLFSQLLGESLAVGTLSAAGGILLAVWLTGLLGRFAPEGIPRLESVAIDGVVLGLAVALGLLISALAGLAPALRPASDSLANAMVVGGRGAITPASRRGRAVLIAAELMLAAVLVAGAGLLMRSFVRLVSVDPGFAVSNALTFSVSLPRETYPDPTRQRGFVESLLSGLESLPGVESAAAVLALPLTGASVQLTYEIGGRSPLPPSQQPIVRVRVATPRYFETLGIPLVRGRLLSGADTERAPQVAIINQSAARVMFPGEDPLGRRLLLQWRNGSARAGGEIVGIVGDVRDSALNEPEPPQVYIPYAQWPLPSMSFVVRTSTDALSLAPAVREEVARLDPRLAISELRTLDDILDRSVSRPRFYAALLTTFAAAALIMAGVGVFGVVSYSARQRTREIGIRMALGATRGHIVRSVAGETLAAVWLGAGTGVALTLLIVPAVLDGLLFETPAHDPLTYVGLVAVLGAVAAVAVWLPVARATRVDPMIALRWE